MNTQSIPLHARNTKMWTHLTPSLWKLNRCLQTGWLSSVDMRALQTFAFYNVRRRLLIKGWTGAGKSITLKTPLARIARCPMQSRQCMAIQYGMTLPLMVEMVTIVTITVSLYKNVWIFGSNVDGRNVDGDVDNVNGSNVDGGHFRE